MNPNFQVMEVAVSSVISYLNQGWKIVGSPYVKTSYMYASNGQNVPSGETTYLVIIKEN